MNPRSESSPDPSLIRLALPSKGSLFEGTIALLRTAGYKVSRSSDRQYEATIARQKRFHVVFMRPTDIVTQVQEGRCQLGITGYDLFAEYQDEVDQSVVVHEDLGFGGCRLVLAVPESWIDVTHVVDLIEVISTFKKEGRRFRISTKYPSLTRKHLQRWGIHDYQIVESDGALELHPSLGIADIIVDLTSSGTTLKDNRLREIPQGTVLSSSACLIGHAPSLTPLAEEGVGGPLALILDAIDGTHASEGMLHLEVVGGPSQHGPETARGVAEYLQDHGAQYVARGEIWDAGDQAGWRVTALVEARCLTGYQRELFGRGASRVVGIPAQFVFGRDESMTYDRLLTILRERAANHHRETS